ncbi:hypothetical protein DFH07DRAFT_775235 [Mycena maculata]|uniref:O-methyltransferase domain-containing protein n=1 Tax=Mycena maculata TaxID=230809 RepID=A0AAD7ITG8_9AGAR|nr:hypothetical protein DFH07DRAFT_775235 [Mycena maculata]
MNYYLRAIKPSGKQNLAVATVDARCEASSGTFNPDLDGASNAEESEMLVRDSEAWQSWTLGNMSLGVGEWFLPTPWINEPTGLQFLLSAALSVVVESSTPEIIHEAGPEGCHVDDIAKKNGIESTKIARVLRDNIIFGRSPNVFTHDRVSALLDFQETLGVQLPEDKYQGAEGYSALIQLNTDETFKAAAYIQDVLLDQRQVPPESEDEFNTPVGHSGHISAFVRGTKSRKIKYGSSGLGWRWMCLTGFHLRARYWKIRFEWSLLPEKAIIVDVGGGIGSTSLEIACADPRLRFVVQDRAAVVHRGEKVLTVSDLFH